MWVGVYGLRFRVGGDWIHIIFPITFLTPEYMSYAPPVSTSEKNASAENSARLGRVREFTLL